LIDKDSSTGYCTPRWSAPTCGDCAALYGDAVHKARCWWCGLTASRWAARPAKASIAPNSTSGWPGRLHRVV